MAENKVELEIELSEDAWVVLEDYRIKGGFETMDNLIGYILEKELERYNLDEISEKAVNL